MTNLHTPHRQPGPAAASTTSAGGHPTAVRRMVTLLFTGLGLSVVFAALTVAFRSDVVDFQLARDPAQIREELELSLWIRALLVLVVAVGYVWVARRLRRGSRRAYLRVRVISLVGLVAVGYLMISGEYPTWLRGVQGLQLLVLAALVVVANLRSVRESFPRDVSPTRRSGSRPAALLLVVLTPVVAELSLGSVPVAMAWLTLLYVPIYGAGALLVRELVRRVGGGWGSVMLMGVAYGLLEEGLALQSLTSPHLYGAADWAPRLLGVSTAYTELNLPYHAVFSVAIPIALVELLFPRHGREPYLRTGGVVVAGVVTVLGAALVRVSFPPFVDPGYVVPPVAVVTVVVLIAALSAAALWLLPRRAARGLLPVPPPSPVTVGLVGGVAVLAFLALLFPFGGARQPAFTHGLWVLVPMAAAAALAVVVGVRLGRWGAASTWTGRHRLAVIGGALVAHTVFGIVAESHTVVDRVVMATMALVTILALVLLDRRLPRTTVEEKGAVS